MIEFEQDQHDRAIPVATIKVIGVGGAGGNTINSIIDSGYQGIECIAANTDAQALEISKAQTKVQIGVKSTKGLGTGANPEVGRRAAEEDLDKIMEVVDDADIVFLTGGMGGGTGSGALPVIARALREKNILSIAIVTKPFTFEGKRRARLADDAIAELEKESDTLIVIPNQKLLDVVDEHVSMIDAFAMINDVLSQSVRSITDIITKHGYINVDFSDVRAIMKDRGLAVMGTGRASGEGRAGMAAIDAISSPLLENMSVKGAHGVLLNITGGRSLGLHEISQAASIVYEQAHEDANIILGSVIDESLGDDVVVTIIATGFERELPQEQTLCAKAVLDRSEKVAVAVEQEVIEHYVAPAPDVVKEVLKEHEGAHLDLQDLDVPTFLRRKASEHDEYSGQ
jgi:cell division protein FtsZ